MTDIKDLISKYERSEGYKVDKNAEKSYNGLKDLLDVVEAEKKFLKLKNL